MTEIDRAARGRELRSRAQGRHHAALNARLTELDPELAAMSDDHIFGRVWDRPGLEFRDRMLVAIVALASAGNTAQLRNYLHGALQDGMDPDEIHEAFVMLTVYAGFPTALAAVGLLREVRDAHERSRQRDDS